MDIVSRLKKYVDDLFDGYLLEGLLLAGLSAIDYTNNLYLTAGLEGIAALTFMTSKKSKKLAYLGSYTMIAAGITRFLPMHANTTKLIYEFQKNVNMLVGLLVMYTGIENIRSIYKE